MRRFKLSFARCPVLTQRVAARGSRCQRCTCRCHVSSRLARYEPRCAKPNTRPRNRRTRPRNQRPEREITTSTYAPFPCTNAACNPYQAYVALSRARTMQGLGVLDFAPTAIRADPRVLSYYRGLGDGYPYAGQRAEGAVEA
eukprot:791222-Rhodomonas_salina.1